MRAPACIAITGLDTFVGRRLADRLRARRDAPRVIGVDVDLASVPLNGGAAGDLAESCARERVEVLVHLARWDAASREIRRAADPTGIGRSLEACSAAGVRRLVVGSSAMVYGADPANPSFLAEDRALASAGPPSVRALVDAERRVAEFSARRPDVEVAVLRPCWIAGPTARNAFVRHVDRERVPLPIGYDPLLQLVHEDDAVSAFERAALESRAGVYNVAGTGALPISTLLALAGKRALRVPRSWFERIARSDACDAGLFDYLRYLWVADGERGFRELGRPRYSTKEAWMSFVSARRLRRYR